MTTLILNGISHSNDNSITNFIAENLMGEYKIINLYSSENNDTDISSDNLIETCDNIILISPVVFGTLSGRIIDFATRYIEKSLIFTKSGATILISKNENISSAAKTAEMILRCFNVQDMFPCVFVNSKWNKEIIIPITDWINAKWNDVTSLPNNQSYQVTKYSSPQDKINLFRSLFKGREDVYALRWYNNKTEKSGYSPVCSNKWMPGVCNISKVKCADCNYRSYIPLDDKAIYAHLCGKDELCRDVIGIYPMLIDETTNMLVLDFDDGEWKKDVSAVRDMCRKHNIPYCVERSRSGEGAHLWIFFETALSAVTARKLGSIILTEAMKKRHNIKFSSYDRMFPNQDTMPSGGFGNLIALPLQKQAVLHGNSVFVDEAFTPYPDQWAYLSSVEKMTEASVSGIIKSMCGNSDVGELYSEKEVDNSLEIAFDNISENIFPSNISIISSNMLYVPKNGVTNSGLNRIKRLASFKNPEFYKAQAMRMSTYGKPRIISLADENDEHIMIPRGCKEELEAVLTQNNCTVVFDDETVKGKNIDIKFNGELRDDQYEAVVELMKYDNGIVAATTAFGKTIAAIGLIAERKKIHLFLFTHRLFYSSGKRLWNNFLL